MNSANSFVDGGQTVSEEEEYLDEEGNQGGRRDSFLWWGSGSYFGKEKGGRMSLVGRVTSLDEKAS